jgi:glycosyltransferase involved in cell wall biosynthesis
LHEGLKPAAPSARVAEGPASAARACVVGIVSVAPTSEMSGQGRVLAQLVDGAGTNKVVFFSDAPVESSVADGTAIRLAPPDTSTAASIRKRAAEIAVGAARTGCTILIGCSGSPYDLTATALAARYLNLPFLAYLFDDPIYQWPTRSSRAAAGRLSKIWLPLAKTIIVTNEFLAKDWRKRGAARVTTVRNPAADIEGAPGGRAASPRPAGAALPIVYTGSVYHAQADAFRNLLSALNASGGEFHLHVFTSQARSTVTGCGLKGPHVTRHDHVAAAEVPAVLSAAAFLFLPLGFDTGIPGAIRTASPAKLGDYLRSGRPILAHVPADSFVAHFCRHHDCALVVDRPDAKALADAARALARGGPDVSRMVANAKTAGELFQVGKARQEFWSSVDRAVADDRHMTSRRASVLEAETTEAARTAGVDAIRGGEQGDAELPDAPILLFIGALAPLKGPDFLLEAFAQTSETFPDVCLLLIGPDRGMRAQLAARARTLGIGERVHFRASIDEPLRREAYLRAAALVVPSRSDVMPFAVLEAGAAGVPVLATNACNCDALEQIGGGLVVAPNSAALAEGLSQMLGDREARGRMGERLRAFVLERYRWLDGDAETVVGLPIDIVSPHLPPPKLEQPPHATAVKESLKRRARRGAKRLLIRVPAVGRYISEKHVIAAERDQAVRDREAYRSLLEAERAAKEILLAERDALLRAYDRPRHGISDRQDAAGAEQERELSLPVRESASPKADVAEPQPEPHKSVAAIRRVLLVDFDIYSTIGGGQRFYRTVIERNPDAEFQYLSRGPDIERKQTGRLPRNAVPILLRQTINLAPFSSLEPIFYFPRWLQHQALYIAASVAGRHFDAVDVPSYVPVSGVLRHAFRLFGVTADRTAVSLLGWLSVGIGNAYEAKQLEPTIATLKAMEDDGLKAADIVYTISDLHRQENEPRYDRPIEVIDMHDVLDPPIQEAACAEPPDRPDLWFIGRLDRNKGPDLFVDIAARLPRSLYGACFASGPDGEVLGNKWSDQVTRRARMLGVDLRYEGALDDDVLAARALAGGSIVVIPSRADSFNYVALEAISRGTPIMLSEAAGAVEFLRAYHPGLPIMTMRPDDIDGAATTLTRFLQNYKENALAFRRAIESLVWPEPNLNFLLRLYERSAPTPHEVTMPAPVVTPHPAPAMPAPYRNWDGDDPLLTIIVPTYRRPEWLVSCLASLAAARPRRTTVLVVDDGSPPEMEVPAIVAAYAPMAEVISLANGGESNAINVGLAQAKTPFAMMLGDDDVIEPSWPAEALATMTTDDAIAVYPDWAIIDIEGKLVEEHHLVECTADRLVSDHWCLPGPGTVFRRAAALAIGGRNPGIRLVGDYDFYLRLAMHGHLRHVPRLGGYWRLHTGNASMAKSRQLATEHVAVIGAHLEECRRVGRPALPAQERRARATAHMAAGVILARDGDIRSSHWAFARAWMLDRGVVRCPPVNLAAYPQFYPSWLKKLNQLSTR